MPNPVDTAKAEGRERATKKHTGEVSPQKHMQRLFKDLYDYGKVDNSDADGKIVLELTEAQYAMLCKVFKMNKP